MGGDALEVNTIQVVLLDHVRDCLHECSPVGGRTNACGKMAGACPAAH